MTKLLRLPALLAVGAFLSSVLATGQTALPEARTLLDRYMTATGGKQAYAAIKQQTIRGTMEIQPANLSGQMLAYIGQGGKLYMAVDMPGAGKFESGSDGKIAWERSAMTGARIVPRAPLGTGLMGPGPDTFTDLEKNFSSIETVAQEQANGAPCYAVSMLAKGTTDPIRMCFDVANGYLTRLTIKAKTPTGDVPVDLLMSEYRTEGSLKVAHHMETQMAGQPIVFTLNEVVFNGHVPESAFLLPEDIRALQAKQAPAEKQP